MKEERLQILKMVEDGKISVEDAEKLLQAIRPDNWKEAGPSFDERVKEFSQNAESFAKDLGAKTSALYKGVEPKIKKATKVVVEKTAYIVDELSKSLNETLKNMNKDKDTRCCGDDGDKDEDGGGCCCCGPDEPKEN